MRSIIPLIQVFGLLILFSSFACVQKAQELSTPHSLVFTGPAKGCASFLVYQTNDEGNRSLAVVGNREALGLTQEPQSFSIGATDQLGVTVLAYDGNIDSYYCDDALGDEPKLLDKWEAVSGAVRIHIVEDDLQPAEPGQLQYTLNIQLENVRLESSSGDVVEIEDHTIPITRVGWLPG